MYSKSDTLGLLDQIRRSDEAVLKEIYLEHREEFINWLSKKFETNKDVGLEIYHDSFATMVTNVKKGKLTELSSSLKTYLFSIGRNKFLEQNRKSSRVLRIVAEESLVANPTTVRDDSQIIKLRSALHSLGDPCSKLLKLFYYQKASMQEIAIQLGYKNSQTAKNQKYKCIKRLKEMLSTV
ncbi:MAG: sigma-70 family RNA polymerase sigma factor [Saprospiraceae bacterium]|nr:sigma-70 family RNA polymerase sigma factor [Saprospiraceae bacterium]